MKAQGANVLYVSSASTWVHLIRVIMVQAFPDRVDRGKFRDCLSNTSDIQTLRGQTE